LPQLLTGYNDSLKHHSTPFAASAANQQQKPAMVAVCDPLESGEIGFLNTRIPCFA